jgi:hypothetical protein
MEKEDVDFLPATDCDSVKGKTVYDYKDVKLNQSLIQVRVPRKLKKYIKKFINYKFLKVTCYKNVGILANGRSKYTWVNELRNPPSLNYVTNNKIGVYLGK